MVARMENCSSFRNGGDATRGFCWRADWFLADRGYDASWLREAPKGKAIKVCILGRKSRKKAAIYDERRSRIEIMFGRLKDWPIVGKTVPRTVF